MNLDRLEIMEDGTVCFVQVALPSGQGPVGKCYEFYIDSETNKLKARLVTPEEGTE